MFKLVKNIFLALEYNSKNYKYWYLLGNKGILKKERRCNAGWTPTVDFVLPTPVFHMKEMWSQNWEISWEKKIYFSSYL